MRILVILNDLDIGGAQNYTINLMNCFVYLGHEVFLRVLSNNIPLEDRLNKSIDTQIWARQKKIDISVIKKIREEIIYGNYDLIISSYVVYTKLASLFLKNKTRILYPIHSTIPRTKRDYYFYYLLYRLKNKNEVFISSIDNQTKYLERKYKLRESFFQQIYNGIDTDRFYLPPVTFNRGEFLKTIGLTPKERIILMVAGYREEKRHIDAIKAFEILNKEIPNIRLVCVGDNREKEKKELQNFINQNRIENITLLIASEAGDVRNYYWSAELFTLTSNKVETFPISVLEALACGLPCVLTDTGGARDIIKNEINGFVIPIEDTLSIANAWKKILLRSNNFNKINISDFVKTNFSIKNSAKDYLKLI